LMKTKGYLDLGQGKDESSMTLGNTSEACIKFQCFVGIL